MREEARAAGDDVARLHLGEDFGAIGEAMMWIINGTPAMSAAYRATLIESQTNPRAVS